jgi:integrase
MPRPATGQAVRRKNGVWALRFRANGRRQYQTLGSAEEGWNRQRAEQELRHVMADVERGTWRPPDTMPVAEASSDPTFHEFASEWFEATKGEWREKTRLDYEWQLTHHLLPFFRDYRLSQITVREIDRYRQRKVAEGEKITAAAASGRPLIDEYVDKRGRARRRPRRALSATSIRRRVLDKSVARANEKLTEAGDVLLPDGLTPHKLRHTFASILVALGVDPGSVMNQLGHADPGFTLRVYRHGMRRDGEAKARLWALVCGVDWAPLGTGAPNGVLPEFVTAHPSTPIPHGYKRSAPMPPPGVEPGSTA